MSDPRAVTLPRVRRLWLPLAASWALMAIELPLLAAVVARLPDEEVQLAAYGAVAFPISLVIEAPIIMLLAASTALCTNGDSYRKVHRFMWACALGLTALHAAVAFTPLYEVVARDWLGTAPEVLEPGRTGLRWMLPWTGMIAYRRFQQGVLIRAERSRGVTEGTAVRLLVNASVLLGLAASGRFPGIVVATCAISSGVTAEALYVAWRVRPCVRALLAVPAPPGPTLDLRTFLRFYVPLAVTPLVTLLLQPLGAAAMNRLPMSLPSLAAWPAVHGLVFLTRSVGLAYNEVVVTLVGEPGAAPALARFRGHLAFGTMGVLVVLVSTPLADLWFRHVSDLSPLLAALAALGTALAVPMPALQAYQSHDTGFLVHARRTRAVTEATVVFFVVSAVGLGLLVASGQRAVPGIVLASATFSVASLAQTLWLAARRRSVERRAASAA